jgi:hypothetical protein
MVFSRARLVPIGPRIFEVIAKALMAACNRCEGLSLFWRQVMAKFGGVPAPDMPAMKTGKKGGKKDMKKGGKK